MRFAILPILAFGAMDPAAGCDDCHPEPTPRPAANADVPEHMTMPPPVLSSIDTQQVAPLSNVPSLHFAEASGTDLGVSFVRDGQIVFLFGDTMPRDPDDACCDDAVALTPDTPFAQRAPLEFQRRGDGRFLLLGTPGTDLQGMEVPVEGIAKGADTYVFFSGGWGDDTQRHEFLALGKTQGTNFATMQTQFIEPSWRFINVQAVEKNGEYFLFGSGTYRKSAVYLARTSDLTRKSAWKYWSRNNGYVNDEAGASQIVPENCVGEFSVRYEPKLSLYLMTYNCGTPRGILLRTAEDPEGPWTQPILIFDPAKHGYGKFMHAPGDALSDPGKENEWGGEYGPYLVPSWTTVQPNGDVDIYYALSSWNPYQAHIVRSTLRRK